MAHKTRRAKYSKSFGKKGRTIKRKLYSYYNKMIRSAKRKNSKKKKGGWGGTPFSFGGKPYELNKESGLQKTYVDKFHQQI